MSLHLRRAAMAAVSVLALSTGVALADPHGGHGGGPAAAAPHAAPAMPHAAPAMSHMAAPAAPHMAAPAAPHMAAPHFAAQPHMAAPHFAAPARNLAMPHGGPRFAGPREAPRAMVRGAPRHETPHVAEGRGGPHGAAEATTRAQRSSAEHGARGAPPAEAHALEHGRGNAPGATALEQRGGLNGHETVGQSPTAGSGVNERTGIKGDKGDLSRLEQRQPEQRRAPIIRNSVFAGQQAAPRGEREAFAQSTFRGHFTQSALYDRRDHHHHHLGFVLGFVGPLFWPYAYNDFVDYTFSPYAYDTFWPYAYDDVFAGIYGGYAPEYYASEDAYAYAGSAGSESVYDRAQSRASQTTGSTSPSASAERICSGQARGLTDFSVQKIADQVQPNQNQQALLDALKTASVKAVDIMQQACPGELPSTPTGRLAAMRARVDAMLKAVEVVRPALDKFYQSLSDEQRERFIAVDQGEQAGRAQRGADLNDLCQGDLRTKSGLPIDRIERTLHLNTDQEMGLRSLDQATLDSAKMLQAKCQPDQSLTPPGRLAAMADRLQVMEKALDTTQAALTKFYGLLNDEQKAQFDRISVRAS
jgi:LTXXQ motif family protein